MSVWFAIPSKRPPEEAEPVLKLWRERGYKIALWRDDMDFPYGIVDYIRADPYPGYSIAVNSLVRDILSSDEQAEWIVTGGDDVEPDPNHSAEEIARECSDWRADTFGVMQPTGDRWGEHDIIPGKVGAYIDRICGSPWMGREFCRRMYQGNGPLYSGYFHMFEDEELQCVAQKLGVLWQRRDLTQYHRHYGRLCQPRPAFLDKAAGREHWREAEAIFKCRWEQGFPGHEPIP